MELLVFLENWESKVTSNHDTYEVSYGPPCNKYHCCLQHYPSKPEQPMLPHNQGGRLCARPQSKCFKRKNGLNLCAQEKNLTWIIFICTLTKFPCGWQLTKAIRISFGKK